MKDPRNGPSRGNGTILRAPGAAKRLGDPVSEGTPAPHDCAPNEDRKEWQEDSLNDPGTAADDKSQPQKAAPNKKKERDHEYLYVPFVIASKLSLQKEDAEGSPATFAVFYFLVSRQPEERMPLSRQGLINTIVREEGWQRASVGQALDNLKELGYVEFSADETLLHDLNQYRVTRSASCPRVAKSRKRQGEEQQGEEQQGEEQQGEEQQGEEQQGEEQQGEEQRREEQQGEEQQRDKGKPSDGKPDDC